MRAAAKLLANGLRGVTLRAVDPDHSGVEGAAEALGLAVAVLLSDGVGSGSKEVANVAVVVLAQVGSWSYCQGFGHSTQAPLPVRLWLSALGGVVRGRWGRRGRRGGEGEGKGGVADPGVGIS